MAINFKDKLLGFFNIRRGDRPDAVEEDTRPTLKRYFKLLGRRFWQLITLNLMMLPMVVPICLGWYIYTLSLTEAPTSANTVFSQIFAVDQLSHSPASTILLDLFGEHTAQSVYTGGIWPVIGIAACALFLFVTFGWQNVGSAYILRNMVRGEAVFIWSDYFYAVKRNLKQGLFLGMIDFVALFLLVFDFVFFWNKTGANFWTNVGFWAICALGILYFLMRFYIYLLLVTFDLSIRKILKNALIFTMLGIKRNLMAVLGLVLVTAINAFAILLLINTPIGGVPIILPFLYYLAFTAYTTTYAAYPIIERYMITPYIGANDTDDEEMEIEESESEAPEQ